MYLTFAEALTELVIDDIAKAGFDPGQARDDHGRWAIEAESGAEGTAVRLHTLSHDIPPKHLKLLTDAGVKVRVVRDLAVGRKALLEAAGNNSFDPKRVARGFFFVSGKTGEQTIMTGATWAGRELVSPEGTMVHEMAHAIDFNSPLGQWGYSTRLDATMREEMDSNWANFPVQRFYAEHYAAGQHAQEWFAELYTAAYLPKEYEDRRYFGMLTRQQVLQRFPKSIVAIKAL